MGFRDLTVGEDCHHVPGKPGHRVGLDRFRLSRAPVATQVGDDYLKPGIGQRRHLVPPQPAGVGEAMQEHDGATLPRDLVLDTDAVDVYPTHWSSLWTASLPSPAGKRPSVRWPYLARDGRPVFRLRPYGSMRLRK